MIIYVISEEKTAKHLPTPPENVTTITCKLQDFFHLTEGLLRSFKRWSSEESQLWVVIGGSEKNRL